MGEYDSQPKTGNWIYLIFLNKILPPFSGGFFMINYNGTISDDKFFISVANRGLNYGDALFETIRFQNSRILYWEDHYFRLMASMRILRMEIPMTFTMEYLSEEIKKAASGKTHARIKLLVWRREGGKYTPTNRNVDYAISAEPLEALIYKHDDSDYEIELFKDFYVNRSLLSTLKTTTKTIQVLAAIYAQENDYQNCLLLNEQKNVVEATNGNLFLVFGNTVVTPSVSEGCLNGIMRKTVLKLLQADKDLRLEERAVSPFELQKADELFITNVIVGIRSVTKYRKKEYGTGLSQKLIARLNTMNLLSEAG